MKTQNSLSRLYCEPLEQRQVLSGMVGGFESSFTIESSDVSITSETTINLEDLASELDLGNDSNPSFSFEAFKSLTIDLPGDENDITLEWRISGLIQANPNGEDDSDDDSTDGSIDQPTDETTEEPTNGSNDDDTGTLPGSDSEATEDESDITDDGGFNVGNESDGGLIGSGDDDSIAGDDDSIAGDDTTNEDLVGEEMPGDDASVENGSDDTVIEDTGSGDVTGEGASGDVSDSGDTTTDDTENSGDVTDTGDTSDTGDVTDDGNGDVTNGDTTDTGDTTDNGDVTNTGDEAAIDEENLADPFAMGAGFAQAFNLTSGDASLNLEMETALDLVFASAGTQSMSDLELSLASSQNLRFSVNNGTIGEGSGSVGGDGTEGMDEELFFQASQEYMLNLS